MNDRTLFAWNIAVYFFHHLIAEQSKDSSLIDSIRFDHQTARQINGRLIERMKQDFPQIENSPAPSFNFIEEWTLRNDFKFSYIDFVYEAYNIIFYERILDLLKGSSESKENFINCTNDVFNKFNYRQDGFSISFFIRVENNMRELLREIAYKIEHVDHTKLWDIIFTQSKEYQEIVNEFFEKILEEEKALSDRLLKNILPDSIAEELKKKNKVEPVSIALATVLFTDFKGFTGLSTSISPSDLIVELDECFSLFDSIIEKWGVEKIKTIGDSYMCAGGVPDTNNTHLFDVALVALSMREEFGSLKKHKENQNIPFWDIRIGFHTGPLVAGVIGHKKFSYDIWGDTVNTASRMESSGEAGKINVSSDVFLKLQYLFLFTGRGSLQIKGKGDLNVYFLERLRPQFSADEKGIIPNEKFMEIYRRIRSGEQIRFSFQSQNDSQV